MTEHRYISRKSYNTAALEPSPPVQVPAWAAVVAEHRPHVETPVTENDASINNLDSAKPQQAWLLYARARLRRDSEEFPHATTRQLLLQAAQSVQPYLGRFVCDGTCVAT